MKRKGLFKKLMTDNSGFSLIELIVSVMILAVVVSPLLHTMVTSARTSAKSRTMRNATLAAQNIVETINASSLATIVDDISTYQNGGATGVNSLSGVSTDAAVYTYDVSSSSYVPLEAIHYHTLGRNDDRYFVGIEGVRSSNSIFDAMVELDASAYPHINDKEISVYTEMNAVYSQPADLEDGTLQNPDSLAAAKFADEATYLSLVPHSKDEFIHKMKRQISITVYTSGTYVTAEVEYTYSTDFNYTLTETVGGVDVTTPYTAHFTDRHDYLFFSGSATEFSSVHFFYYPNYYQPSSATGYESIVINNSSGLPFTFFLIKQNTPGYVNGVKGGLDYETNYRANLELREPSMGQGNVPIATVYTNMDKRLGSGADLFAHSTFRVYNGVWFDYGTSSGTLVASKYVNRLYKVKVDLYPEGSGFTGDPILSFDASKVE